MELRQGSAMTPEAWPVTLQLVLELKAQSQELNSRVSDKRQKVN